MKMILSIILFWVAGSAWAEGSASLEDQFQSEIQKGDLVILGSPPGTELTALEAGTLKKVDYQGLLDGSYHGKLFEIDCVPFAQENPRTDWYQYRAFPTDDTGFGWLEDEPLILVSNSPLYAGDPGEPVRFLGSLVWFEGDHIPVFQVMAGETHAAWN